MSDLIYNMYVVRISWYIWPVHDLTEFQWKANDYQAAMNMQQQLESDATAKWVYWDSPIMSEECLKPYEEETW